MIDLGKWPTMRVVGEPVTPEQAGDILICTAPWFDTFPKTEGWDREARVIAAEYGMPLQPARPHGNGHDDWFRETWHVWLPAFGEWRRKYGVLDVMNLDGPANDLIGTSYRAWCNWDGLVAGQFNIGKWPDADTVAEFFSEVADRFPYLRLTVDLVSEFESERGVITDATEYSRACRINVGDGCINVHEGAVESLVLPDAWFDWQNGADRFVEQGVSPERLRQAFYHLTNEGRRK